MLQMERKKATLIIAGGTGYLGKLLIDYFNKEYHILLLTRKKSMVLNGIQLLNWNDNWEKHLNKETIIINLAGKSINCLFTKKNKIELLNSRIKTTKLINKAIAKAKNPPKLFLNASGISIYKETYNTDFDEEHFEYGTDFLSELSKKWEDTFYQTKIPQTRKVAIRISPVLGLNSKTITALIPVVKLGLGGKQGNGRQLFPFIHQTDFILAIKHIIDTNTLSGSVNLIAPTPTTNKNFMKEFRKKLHVKNGLPTPAFLLYLSKYFTKIEPEIILKSLYAKPVKLIESNYDFKHKTISSALSEILQNK